RAIKKASLSIARHTIKDKHSKAEIVGAVRWIDNSWNVLGKAHFYKREFFSGVEDFEYVARTYKSNEKYEAWLWLFKTYNEMNLLSQSDSYITLIKNDKKFPDKMRKEFLPLYAEFYLKQGMYPDAIRILSEAITLSKSKKDKARFSFIIAQLYETEKNNKKAAHYYTKCIGYKPIYDMVFYAKIKRSLLLDHHDEGGKKIKSDLLKMAKDIKNDDFLDVIYYTLGQLEEKDNNEDKAVEYYKISAKKSTSNPNQKGKSYLRLGDISFDRTNYTAAEAYYDSTVVLIKEDFPGYETVINKKKSLTTLVGHLRLISKEDSLQRIAGMDTITRDKFIKKIIKKLEEDEQKALDEKENAKNNELNTNNGNTVSPVNGTTTPGAFYFYNKEVKAFGINDFVKKWGSSRKLEDNWRRSNKQSVLDVGSNDTDPSDTSAAGKTKKKVIADNKTVAFYLKDLPLTQPLMDSSNKKIVESYYALGSIYREDLQNNKKAIESFQMLNARFPRNKYEAVDYYQMYRMYLGDKNQTEADKCKSFLLNNYPESDAAKILNDPDYASNANAKRNVVEAFYGATYDMY
ncbi:MAG TPA: tetratricopeptide repeat protein, partial [Nitrosopumilaceae archaeon]|nr:tetratricopeptide repeat protein [Nitrosopumilaceae archaeon]